MAGSARKTGMLYMGEVGALIGIASREEACAQDTPSDAVKAIVVAVIDFPVPARPFSRNKYGVLDFMFRIHWAIVLSKLPC